MKKSILVYALFSSIALYAGENMNVSLCNLGQLPGTVVAHAQEEASAVFRAIDVEIVWRECGEGPGSEEAARAHWYTIRLRSDAPPRFAGSRSLDAMGFAYVTAQVPGNMADAYYKAVEWVAGGNTSDAAALLGCVMAHELGHLLLGPGHVPNGIMRPAWKSQDVNAVRKRWLTFNAAQTARIHATLQTTEPQ